jgi:predicted ATPase with chaperone activity
VAAHTSRSGSLAPNARLRLDDLAESTRNDQEMICQPLEESAVTITGSQMTMTCQSDFALVPAGERASVHRPSRSQGRGRREATTRVVAPGAIHIQLAGRQGQRCNADEIRRGEELMCHRVQDG